MIASIVRRLGGAGLALAFATGVLALPATAPEVRAAAPDLTIVSDARYDVQPDQHRVRVTLSLVLTNHLKDTVTRRYYFDQAFLAVLPNTANFKFNWEGSGTPEVHVSEKTADYTLLRLDLGQRLFAGKSATYQLRFDMVDPGGEPTRDVRVGETLVSFPVWAFATDETPGGSVQVVFPAGFEVDVEAGEIPEPTTDADGQVIFETGELDQPLDFFAYLVGDRPGAYSERTVTTPVDIPVQLRIRAWPDDPAWSERVGDLVTRALPLLSRQIGLGWPRDGGLVVQEAASRSTGGYAGLFDPSEGRIEVAYYADDFVVLHEAAHAWFNGGLLADRWANEAFASYYGLRVAELLGVPAEGDELTADLVEVGMPLNDWGPIGRKSTGTEDYAYAASLFLAEEIAERAGSSVLQQVWADAAAGVGAYQPTSGDPSAGSGSSTTALEPELVDAPPDWRGLLDLLEEHDTDAYDDLWRRWVARDSDLAPLDDRLAARARYDKVVQAAGDWELPKPVRDAMRAWQFAAATDLLDRATAVLGQRAAIESAAASSGLTPPPNLEEAFSLPDGFDTAALEADAELDAIERYDAAAATRPAEPNPLQVLGMWETLPDADLARSRDLFATGDLASSTDAAAAAAMVWTTAEDVGRGRLVSIIALTLAALLAVALFVAWVRSIRRRRRRFAARWVGRDRYDTLAATLDPPPPTVVGDKGRKGADLD